MLDEKTPMKDRLLLFAFLLSGAAALGYELLWARLLALALGSESLGVLGVLAGFFGGLALGSWWLHEPTRRARDPVKLFALLEIAAACYALLSPHLLTALARYLPPVLGPAAGDNQSLLALVLSLGVAMLALLPATVCLGATLPALVEARRRAFTHELPGRGLGRLYAANTWGATLGTLASVWVVLPRWGMVWGSAVLAATGLSAAGLAWLWRRGRDFRQSVPESSQAGSRTHAKTGPRTELGQLYALLTLTGLLAVGLEVVGIQILAQILEDTVYTFAGVLAMYLLGTALGAWCYAAWTRRLDPRQGQALTVILLLAQAASVALMGLLLRASPFVLQGLAPPGVASYPRHIWGELGVAMVVFLLPTWIMGALFSHLMAQISEQGVGRAYALNTLGGTLAPFVFGLLLIRTFGYGPALYAAGWAYLAVAVTWAWGNRQRPTQVTLGAAVTAAALLLAPRSMFLLEIPPGWHLVEQRQGLLGLVAVTEETTSTLPGQRRNRRLQINRHFRMGGSLSFGEQRMGHLPLLLQPDARRVAFLGIGTGATLSAVRAFGSAEVEAVELVPEVGAMLPLFAQVNQGVYEDPRVRLRTADARRHIAAAVGDYDLIIGDLFHPAFDGAGSLYSREHFQAVRDHLAPGGLFAQWLPLYQFDLPNLQVVLRTFLAVFPEVHSFLGIYNAQTPALVLLGSEKGSGPRVQLDQLAAKLREPVYADLLMQDPRDLLASYMLDRAALVAFAGAGPLNTDLAPRILFDAPKSAYLKRPELNWSNLAALLPWRQVYPAELVTAADPANLEAFRQAVVKFSAALTHYLEAEVERVRAGLHHPMSDAAIAAYLKSYETAPGFAPAGQILLSLAAAEPTWAERILDRMLARNPQDVRVHHALLRHLEATQQHARFAAALAAARARFGADAFPPMAASP